MCDKQSRTHKREITDRGNRSLIWYIYAICNGDTREIRMRRRVREVGQKRNELNS